MDAEKISFHLIRALLGLLFGLALGFVARRGRFCTLGAVEDVVYAHDTRRARAWMLAAAVAILGVHLLEAEGGLDLGRSIYVSARLEWGAMLIGGTMFGFGMALVGTCGFGALLRLGGGDLKAFLVLLVLGISSYMAISGPTGFLRVAATAPLSLDLAQEGSQRLFDLLGLGGRAALPLALAIAGVLGALAMLSRAFRSAGSLIYGALAVGSLIVAGWWANGSFGFDPFETRPVGSFSFVRPVGDSIFYLMHASGLQADFGVGSVLGVPLGAFLAAWNQQEFRWEAPDDAREARRHIAGAFLMGTGGVTALGCTIGQGLTGLSTLSVGSMMALTAIIIGARAGLYYLVEMH